MGLLEYFERKSRLWLFAVGLALAFGVGIGDYLTGVQISFSVFYTLPIAMVAWFIGFRHGVFLAVFCTLEWLFGDLRDNYAYAHPLIPYWNAIMRFVVFLLITLILSKLRVTVERERRAQQAAEIASRVKSEFLANASHELRTPMNSVIAMADLIVPHISSAEGKNYAAILKSEGEHLLRIINDILDLSKVEAGLYEFEKKTFDLYDLLDRLASAKSIRAREKGLTIAYQIAPDVPHRVVGDGESLRRILVNLMGNSIKFTDQGEVRLSVDMDPAGGAPAWIRFSVSDTGIGIPPEKLDVIFERFTTVDPSLTRRYGGTGLGLNISKKLVEGMGGRLAVESAPGRGSRFFFSIPFDVSIEPFVKISELTMGEAEWELSLNCAARPIRVLLAEDIRSNRVVVEAFLRGVRHELDSAENGEAAVRMFSSKSYDIVLMDVQMPVMDGYTATRKIRELEGQNGATPTPILALTAHAMREEAARSLDAGCDAHLTKPLTRSALLKHLHDLVMPAAGNGGDRPAPQGAPAALPPNLAHLIPEFLVDLREYSRQMSVALDRADFDKIHHLGHGIRGSGGSYGFPEISECGRLIEESARQKNGDEIRRQLDELAQHLRAAAIHA